MAQTGRWMAAVGIALGVLAGCVALADAVLPWDSATNVLTGATAGVVVGAVIAVWADSVINRERLDETAPQSKSQPQPQSRRAPDAPAVRQRVSGGPGVQFAPTGRNRIGNVTVNVNAPPPAPTPPAPPPRDPGVGGGVVPPKG